MKKGIQKYHSFPQELTTARVNWEYQPLSAIIID
jgi:hypothetical protein